jgi:hypothetical protein
MEKKFDEQDSLRLISEMITQARRSFQKGSGNGIILWGYSIAALAILNFVLLRCTPLAPWVWVLTIPLFIGHYFYEWRKRTQALVKNSINKMIGNVWLAFFVSLMLLVAMLSMMAAASDTTLFYAFISPVAITLSGLCLFISGKIMRFRPFVYGALVFWLGSVASVLIIPIWKLQSPQFLILAACMLLGFVIPGHLLNRSVREDV